ncbi:MAG: Uncharacterized protein G01um101493_30 [Microgenomates group bacterium Gr01-1014_93]|nr:MAG: Uncharacterized protein G01um101493_30 [Microgenomates group bacterium Gr01-1014_93]
MSKTKFLLLISLLTSYFILHTSPVNAQSDIAGVYDISDKDTKDGDILIFTPDKGITRASAPYDVHLFGVAEASPSAVFRRVDNTGQPIVRSGIAKINVTSLNGAIKAGEHITSSEIPGSGMRADLSGQSAGVAINDFKDTDGEAFQYKGKTIRQGQISVAIKVEFAELTTPRSINSLFSFLGISLLQNIQDPKGFGQAVRAIFAGLIVLIAIIFSMIILTRSIPKSIEAIGRNPLARKAINISIAMNIAIVILITLAAIFAAFLILRL